MTWSGRGRRPGAWAVVVEVRRSQSTSQGVFPGAAGASDRVGPDLVGLFLPRFGVAGVLWIFASLYPISAILAAFLTLPAEAPGHQPTGG